MITHIDPYIKLARLDKPTGIWLLLLPCWWGIYLAKPLVIPFHEAICFLIGAILLRGAGCTYNDIVDREYDKQVSRTASRPLAADTLTVKQAIVFLVLQLLGGFFILISFPLSAIILGLCSLVLVAIYPWMKRFTYWPQAFLGLTFNWGVFMGWVCFQPSFSPAPFLLYAAGICWTLGYDTIYAHQDKEDDVLIGVKSSALALKENTYTFLTLVYTLMIILLGLAGFWQNMSWMFYGGLIIVASHLAWQVKTLNIHHPDDCMAKFKANTLTGFLVLGTLILGSY